MVEEIVVKEALTNEMLEAGQELLKVLDQNPDITVSAAFWFFRPESNSWRFVVAAPQTHKLGPMKMYDIILSMLPMLPSPYDSLFLGAITVIADDDDLVERLRKLKDSLNGAAGLRFTGGAIDGRYIDDVYIYRIN